MFIKGHKITRAGIKNDPKLMAVKTLLEDAFIRHRSAAYAHLDEMMKDRNEFKYLLSLKASIEPKPTSPTTLIDASNHTHITKVDVANMSDNELIDFLTGRKSGHTAKLT